MMERTLRTKSVGRVWCPRGREVRAALGRRLGVRRLLGLLVACGALLISATAFAKAPHAKAPQAKAPPAVTSHYWEVSIDGQSRKVAAGGTVNYGGSEGVESITPNVVLTASHKGKYSYVYRVVGPPDAGATGISEVSFKSRRTVIDPPIPASVVTKYRVTEPEERKDFLPGTYRFELYVFSAATHEFAVGVTHKEKPTLVESIKLVA
jgi:hypothetical protein